MFIDAATKEKNLLRSMGIPATIFCSMSTVDYELSKYSSSRRLLLFQLTF
jgi:hypothetical protein